jgi:hypothetical protein
MSILIQMCLKCMMLQVHGILLWNQVSLTFTSLSLVLLLTIVLPVLFKYCYRYCYSDSRTRLAVMKGGGLAL